MNTTYSIPGFGGDIILECAERHLIIQGPFLESHAFLVQEQSRVCSPDIPLVNHCSYQCPYGRHVKKEPPQEWGGGMILLFA
jgi:hypothetical protein